MTMTKSEIDQLEEPVKSEKYLEQTNLWTICPLKKAVIGQWAQLGFVLPDQPTRIYKGNMFELIWEGKRLDQFETVDYMSIEDLVTEGWRVD